MSYFLQALGKKGVFWSLLGIFSGVMLAFVELNISVFIQFFLISLGLVTQEIKILGHTVPHFSIESICLLLATIGLVRFVFQLLNYQSSYAASEFFSCKMRNLIVHDLLYQKTGPTNAADVNYKISEIFPKACFFIQQSNLAISNFFQFLFIMIIMFFTTWKESLLGLVGVGLIGFVILKLNKRVKHLSQAVPLEQEKLNKNIERDSRNILFLKITGTEPLEEKKLVESVMNYSSKLIRSYALSNLAQCFAPFLGILLLIVIIFCSVFIFKTKVIVLLSFIYLLVRFVQCLSQFAQSYGLAVIYLPQLNASVRYFHESQKQSFSVVGNRANHLSYLGRTSPYALTTEEDQSNGTEKPVNFPSLQNDDSGKTEDPPPEVIVNNVSFSYLDNKKPVLQNFSLHVSSGEMLGIIGKSGSGKSSLLLLILGVLIPDSGIIQIGHTAPKEYLKQNKNKIGYVGAEPFLIPGTLRENLSYGLHRELNDEEMIDALRASNLPEFANPKGLDYTIATDYSGLSAGQKQRICIARAIISQPSLLILDEATANLDETTENEIFSSLTKLKGKVTVLMVSHRKSLESFADRVVLMKGLNN